MDFPILINCIGRVHFLYKGCLVYFFIFISISNRYSCQQTERGVWSVSALFASDMTQKWDARLIWVHASIWSYEMANCVDTDQDVAGQSDMGLHR